MRYAPFARYRGQLSGGCANNNSFRLQMPTLDAGGPRRLAAPHGRAKQAKLRPPQPWQGQEWHTPYDDEPAGFWGVRGDRHGSAEDLLIHLVERITLSANVVDLAGPTRFRTPPTSRQTRYRYLSPYLCLSTTSRRTPYLAWENHHALGTPASAGTISDQQYARVRLHDRRATPRNRMNFLVRPRT